MAPRYLYWANTLTGGGDYALDKIEGSELADLHAAIVATATTSYFYVLDADSGTAESSPSVIAPDSNPGNKRWILVGTILPNTGLKILDKNSAYTLNIKWNEADSANRTLNLLLRSGNRSLDLYENLTIGNGTDITITGVTAARTFTMNEDFTIGDGNSGTLTFSASGDTLTVGETLTLDGASGKTLTLEENLTIADGQNITITGVTAARSITLNEDLTVVDGQDIELHASGGEKAQLAIDTQNAERTLDMTGNLTVESNSIINQDLSSDSVTAALAKLTITRAASGLLELVPGFTGTGHVVTITPSAALDTEDAHWDGVKIDGNALDPSAVGTDVHGVHIDFSGVTVGSLPHLDGLHIELPKTYHNELAHAIHANHGMLINYDATTAAAGMNFTAYNLVIDAVGSSGGDVHGIDVVVAEGSATVAALGTHTGVDVIHQHVGTATALDKVFEYDDSGSSYGDVTAACGSADTDVAIWEAQDDIMYFGDDAEFDEIVCVFDTVATKHMHFKFYYSTGEGGFTFTQFYPQDDTNGAQENGSIWWDLAAITAAWKVDTVNSIADKYWIKVVRTRLAGTGPTEDTIKRMVGVTYSWSKLGAVAIASLDVAGTIACDTSLTIDANSISAAQLSEVTTFFDSTDISAAEAETLTDGSDADALHVHGGYQDKDATLTAFADLLTAANKIPYATAEDTGSELDLATTVGNPGSDTTLVSEQGIREAITAAGGGVAFATAAVLGTL